MTRRTLAAMLMVILWIGTGTAEAQGWRGWLDRLSGPGEFDGFGVFAEFLCYGERELAHDPTAGTASSASTTHAASIAAAPGRQLFVDVNCSRARRNAWRAVIGLDVGWYSTNRNPLTYAGDPPEDLKKVTLRTAMPYVDIVPVAWLELGAGIGVAWFDGELFGSTSKLMVQPVRITVKPLTLIFADRHPALGILQIRGQAVTFPGGFDAADFGAVPGSWKVGTELLPGAQVVLDFFELLSRNR